jgi:hypothetical protein
LTWVGRRHGEAWSQKKILHASVDRWHVKIAHADRLGDIPHGWAAAGFMLLPREILFSRRARTTREELYIAAGILPRWLRGGGGQGVTVTNAATTYALPFGYTLAHEEANQRVTIDITHPFRK